jgi:short-subunit dehydrogenase
VSSVAGVRGLPKTVTTYAATKAAIGSLAEGLQLELLGKPIKVSAIYPGYIHSELNEHVAKTPLIVGTEVGVRAMVAAIEAEKARAYVPAWPWVPLARMMKLAPLPLLKRLI